MLPRTAIRLICAFFLLSSVVAPGSEAASPAAAEYAKHFDALSKLSVAVSEAMPPEKYDFRPHPESMTFGEVMNHIASTNYLFCAGLKQPGDQAKKLIMPPEASASPSAASKEAVVKYLGDSFAYCSSVISALSEEQLAASHNSPDGYLPGRDVLLVMYIHVAHHRGQAEIYLRDVGIKPPNYRI